MATEQLTIRLADWTSDKEELSDIRRLVFIEEQNVPQELEWDEFDDSCLHFLAFLDNKAIACARLKTDGQIGRMAVLKPYRKLGIGMQLLKYVMHTAENSPQITQEKLYLHAQASAVAFYEKQGFKTVGDVFYEADIPHREMLKKL